MIIVSSEYATFLKLFPENRTWYFMQTVSLGDNLLEMSNPISGKNKEFPERRLLKFLPSMLGVKVIW